MASRWRASAGRVRIGVISDTHGWLDPAIRRHFAGVDHIIHAGDVGADEVLQGLGALASLTAVAGNEDRVGELGSRLPRHATGDVSGIRFVVGHRRGELLAEHVDPAAEGFDLVVTGHTHVASTDWQDGVLYLDPGTATVAGLGKRRTVAVVQVDLDGLDPHIIDLD